MKKSLLALAVVAVAASANAATVYDKDGTSLGINGRIQSVFYSGNHNNAGENDSTIKNSGRFGLEGRTQVADWVSGFAYTQWDVASGHNGDNGWKTRDQYVGADFGEFGKVFAGRWVDATYYAENVTDHYEDAAGTSQGKFNGARRSGQFKYVYDNFGLHAELGAQTAQDNANIANFSVLDRDASSVALDSGFNGALGYTFDDVLGAPLTLRAGYAYLKGQSGNDLVKTNDDGEDEFRAGSEFNNFKHATGAIAWGNLDSGLYLAGLYEYAKLNGFNDEVNSTDRYDITQKGVELAVGYAWDNGMSLLAGYEVASYEITGNYEKGDSESSKITVRRVPVFFNYKLNSNFNVWTECGFNAGSDDELNFEGDKLAVAKKVDKFVWSVGARYSF